jgi:hypothetical protein
MFPDDVVLNVASEFRVVKKKQVGIEDVGMSSPELFLSAPFDRFELPSRLRYGAAKPASLTEYVGLLDLCPIDVASAVL